MTQGPDLRYLGLIIPVAVALIARASYILGRREAIKSDYSVRALHHVMSVYRSLGIMEMISGIFCIFCAFGFIVLDSKQMKTKLSFDQCSNIVSSISTFVIVLSIVVLVHEQYRIWKSLEPGTLLKGFVPEWRQYGSELFEYLFGQYDLKVPRIFRNILGKFFRPFWSAIFIGFFTYRAYLNNSDLQPIFWGIFAGVTVGKMLYEFTSVSKHTQYLYDLRKEHFGYALVRKKDGSFLVTLLNDNAKPFDGYWCFPQIKLDRTTQNVKKDVTKAIGDILQKSTCGLTLETPRYALRSTLKLYDELSQDNWQTAHLFVCDVKGRPSELLSEGFQWISQDNPLLVDQVRDFVQDALRTENAIEGWHPESGQIKYWWRAPIVLNLSNRPQ